MRIQIILLVCTALCCASCKTKSIVMNKKQDKTIDVQGHRGCRGLLPENTIPAFKHAIDLGVTTLELDLVISKDKEVIISHEPFFSHEISITPSGDLITKDNEKEHNIYDLDYEQIKKYDVGSRKHTRFSKQEKLKVSKPSFKEMVHEIEAYVSIQNKSKPYYNIEIKRKPEMDNIFHPDAEEFARLVVDVVKELDIEERTYIQSFDIGSLKEVKEIAPQINLVYLIENEDPIALNIQKLGFLPDVYSPYFKLITPSVSKYCKLQNIQLIPWTVNAEVDMKAMIEIEVDGIITDYPDVLLDLMARMNIPVK